MLLIRENPFSPNSYCKIIDLTPKSRLVMIRLPHLIQKGWMLPKVCFAAISVVVSAPLCAESMELAGPIQEILADRCIDCHDADGKKGGVNLEGIMGDFDPRGDLDLWVKVEAAIAKGKMPPPKKKPLMESRVKILADWFESEFILPGGIQHAGSNYPRRLTREELQNTLEDILHIDLRETVTNSRLHVIPDTIIEKFFAAGVYGDSGFSNDAVTLGKGPADIQAIARCLSLVLSRVVSDEEAMTNLFGTANPAGKIPLEEARLIIDRFGQSAFRRALSADESDAFVGVYKKMAVKRSATDAIKSSMLAILLSPPFFYRFEKSGDGQTPVVGEELAVRLSYFLWSAPPDAILLELADKGELHKPDILKEQVGRMLADPKRVALAENLGGEWFDYKKLRQHSAVDKRSDKMAGFFRTQYEEALLFFDSIIRYDQPIFSLVDSSWGYSNPHQSSIYRLKTAKKTFEVENPLPPVSIHYRSAARQVEEGRYEYRHTPLDLVDLSGTDRGGFITIGSTLSATSTENRTSPIRRGVWVMERILGEHFEQPEDVPDLKETQKKATDQKLKLSHGEILKMHSSQAGCASCHKYIDPIGFGLEGFDQLGMNRTVIDSNPEGEKLHWTSEQIPKAYADRSWDLARPMMAGAEVRVYFQWVRGGHRLDIKNVRLDAGDVHLVDAHTGFSGGKNNKNMWIFTIPDNAPASGWRLTAEVQGGSGTDSNGTITVSFPGDRSPGHRMPNGKSFASPNELKKLLLSDYREQVTDNVIRRVLAYALGRKLEPIDRPAIQKIRASVDANDYRMSSLIEAVVLSYPFTHKETQ